MRLNKQKIILAFKIMILLVITALLLIKIYSDSSLNIKPLKVDLSLNIKTSIAEIKLNSYFKKLSKVCDGLKEEYKEDCYILSGIYIGNRYNAEKSIKQCSKLTQPYNEYCYIGMGFATGEKFYNDYDVSYCNKYNLNFSHGCYNSIINNKIVKSGINSTVIKFECDALQNELKTKCHDAVSFALLHVKNISYELNKCNKLNLPRKDRCYHNLAWKVGLYGYYNKTIKNICNKFDESYKGDCYKGYGRRLAFERDTSDALYLCGNLSNKFTQNCYIGVWAIISNKRLDEVKSKFFKEKSVLSKTTHQRWVAYYDMHTYHKWFLIMLGNIAPLVLDSGFHPLVRNQWYISDILINAELIFNKLLPFVGQINIIYLFIALILFLIPFNLYKKIPKYSFISVIFVFNLIIKLFRLTDLFVNLFMHINLRFIYYLKTKSIKTYKAVKLYSKISIIRLRYDNIRKIQGLVRVYTKLLFHNVFYYYLKLKNELLLLYKLIRIKIKVSLISLFEKIKLEFYSFKDIFTFDNLISLLASSKKEFKLLLVNKQSRKKLILILIINLVVLVFFLGNLNFTNEGINFVAATVGEICDGAGGGAGPFQLCDADEKCCDTGGTVCTTTATANYVCWGAGTGTYLYDADQTVCEYANACDSATPGTACDSGNYKTVSWTWSATYSCCNGDDVTDNCDDDTDCAGSCTSTCRCDQNYAPTHTTPLIVSTSGNNLISDNLTCANQSTSDPNNDTVTNIYNWYRNGGSITVLNMPFDTNTISITSGAVKDYSLQNGTGNNGTISDITGWNDSSKCIKGGCYTFDGSDDYITITDSNSLDIANEITVEAWINDTPGDWWNTSFTRCKDITINYDGATTLIDFPAYVNVTHDPDMQADYDDLRFLNSHCNNATATELNYEIENYTTVGDGHAHIWVKLDTISKPIRTISMYYGNTDVGSGANVTGVWDDNHQGVWHLSEGGTGTRYDSTGENNMATRNYAGDESTSNGKVDGAEDLDGTDDYLIASDSSSLDSITSDITMEAWIKPDIPSTDSGVIDKSAGVNSMGIWSMAYVNRDIYFGLNAVWNRAYTTTDVLTSGQWSYVVLTYEGTVMKIYIDTVEKGSIEYVSSINTDANSLYLGQYYSSAYRHDGIIDEVRISNIVRSVDWINQSYQLMANQNTFVTFGSEEEIAGTVIGKGTGAYEIQIDKNLNVTGWINSQSVSSNISKKWHHVAMTYNGSTQSLYVDGVARDNKSLSGNINTNSEDITIGKGVIGSIDEIKIWNKGLSADQIYQDYLEGANSYTNSTITSSETSQGENWTCAVTPNDATEDGITLNSSNLTIKYSPQTDCDTYKCLIIQDSSGNNVSIFDGAGNLDLFGTVTQSSIGTPDGNDFIIQDSGSSAVAWINDATGNMRLAGTASSDNGGSCTAPANSFIVQDSTGNCKAYIDSSGNLWLSGSLLESSTI